MLKIHSTTARFYTIKNILHYYPALEYRLRSPSHSIRLEPLTKLTSNPSKHDRACTQGFKKSICSEFLTDLASDIIDPVPAVRRGRSRGAIGILLCVTDGQISVLEGDGFGHPSAASGARDALGGEHDGREGIRGWVEVARAWRIIECQ